MNSNHREFMQSSSVRNTLMRSNLSILQSLRELALIANNDTKIASYYTGVSSDVITQVLSLTNEEMQEFAMIPCSVLYLPMNDDNGFWSYGIDAIRSGDETKKKAFMARCMQLMSAAPILKASK